MSKASVIGIVNLSKGKILGQIDAISISIEHQYRDRSSFFGFSRRSPLEMIRKRRSRKHLRSEGEFSDPRRVEKCFPLARVRLLRSIPSLDDEENDEEKRGSRSLSDSVPLDHARQPLRGPCAISASK